MDRRRPIASRVALAVVVAAALGAAPGSAQDLACNGRQLIPSGTLTPSVGPQAVSGSVTSETASGYEIVAPVDGTYTFSLCEEGASASYDTWMCLFDASGERIAQSDDFCALRSRIVMELTAGDYTLAVSGFSTREGDYTLVYFVETLIDCNGRPVVPTGTIAPTAVPQATSGSVNSEISRGYTVEASIASTYTFSLCEEGASASYDTWMCLFDEAGERLAQSDDSCALRSQIVMELEPGTYTLAVSGFSTREGDYTLVYFVETLIDCNGRPVVSAGELVPTSFPEIVSGSVTSAVSQGYTFDADVSTTYTFSLCAEGASATYDTWMCLFDEAGERLAQSDDACGLRSQIVMELEPGTYTLAVSGFSTREGDFTLVYYRDEPLSCGGAFVSLAGALIPGPEPATIVGDVGSAAAAIGYEVHVDVFANCVFSLCTDGGAANFDSRLCLLDADGALVAEDDDHCGLRSEISTPLAAGDYILAVSSGDGAGSFTLAYSCEVPFDCGGRTFRRMQGFVPDTAPALADGVIDALTADLYPIDIRRDSICRFGFCAESGDATFDTTLCFFDATGSLIAQSVDSCGELSELRGLELDAGRYFLGVSGEGTAAGAYRLSYSCAPLLECAGRNAEPSGLVLSPAPAVQLLRAVLPTRDAVSHEITLAYKGRLRLGYCDDGASATFDVRLCLFDAAGRLVAQSEDACRGAHAVEQTLSEGRYTVVVSAARADLEGDYTLGYSAEPDRSCSDHAIPSASESLTPGPLARTVRGRVTREAARSYTVTVGFDGTCRFTFCRDGGEARFDTVLCLYDTRGNVIAENDDACGVVSELEVDLPAGRYELVASAAPLDEGDYTLAYSCSTGLVCSDRPVVASGTTLVPSPVPQSIADRLGSTLSTSYEVVVQFDGACVFGFCSRGSATFDATLCLFDAADRLVAESRESCGRHEIAADLAAGSYTLAVSAAPGVLGEFELAYHCETDFACNGRAVVSTGQTLTPSPIAQAVRGRVQTVTALSYEIDLPFAGLCRLGFCSEGGAADYDTSLCLFDRKGNLVAENDDSCRALSEIRAELQPGRYVLAVGGSRGEAGSYNLTYSCKTDRVCVERAVLPAAATLVPAPAPQTVAGEVVGAATAPSYDIELAYDGRCTFSLCRSDDRFDSFLCLYDERGKEIASDDDACGTLSEISLRLPAGRYSLAVSTGAGAPGGRYALSYDCRPDTSCDERPLGPRLDTLAPAIAPRVAQATLGAALADHYEVQVDEAGLCRFDLCGLAGESDLDTVVCLLDEAGRLLASNDDACGALSSLELELDAGVYALAISAKDAASGPYELEYSCAPPGTVCGERPIAASGETLRPGPLAQTALGELSDDVAVSYAIDVPFDGYAVFTLCADGGEAAFDGTLCLFDASAQLVPSESLCGGPDEVAVPLLAGAYTLAISAPSGQSGDYTLSYRCLPSCDARTTVPGGETVVPGETADVLAGELPAQRALGYTLEVEATGPVTLSFCAEGGSAAFNASLCLYSVDGALVAANDEACGELAELVECLDAGSYLLVVSGHTKGGGAFELVTQRAVGCEPGNRFLRGDCNHDGSVDISDALCTLRWLFQGAAEPVCLAASNVDGTGTVVITDPIYLLSFLFRSGPPPAAPFPRCDASDLESDRAVGCERAAEVCP